MLVCGDFCAHRTLIRSMRGTHPQIFDRLLEAVQGTAPYQGVCPDVGLREILLCGARTPALQNDCFARTCAPHLNF